MANIQMGVPLVFWGQRPPTHEITCICRAEEKRGVATGSQSGQICLWDIYRERETEQVRMRPRCLLFGGGRSIVTLTFVRNWSGERDRIASLNTTGAVTLWDGKDGACLKKTTIPGRQHSGLKSIIREHCTETLLALYGQYSEVYILDSNALSTLCTLKAAYNPNWNSQIGVIQNMDKASGKEGLLAITVDGVAKIWLLPNRNEMKESGEIYEETCKNLTLSAPLALSCCACHGHYSSALVVCKEAWQLYDTTGGNMKLLLIRPCEPEVRAWMGGKLLDSRNIVLWAKDSGQSFIYHLSPRCVPGHGGDLEESINTSTAGCVIQHVLCPSLPPPSSSCLTPASPSSSSSSPISSTTPSFSLPPPPSSPAPISNATAVYVDKYWQILGDKHGRIYLWDFRNILSMEARSPGGANETPPITNDTSSSIADSWAPPAMPCGLTDMLYPHSEAPPTISCVLYLILYGRLVCGQADGQIAVINATQAASVLMLQQRKFSRGWPQHCILRGHKGRVNCLLYPHAHSKAYNQDFLVSGGADFTVRLFDLFSGELAHTFAVHGGEVTNIVSCPPHNHRLQTCVCSIAEDYSVAILSTTERKCLLVAACHSSPVLSVRFRLQQDFLLVSCADGKLYVWQIETASLDRRVDGETAQIIFNSVPDTHQPQPSTSTAIPLQVRSVSVSRSDSLIQVLLFDPQGLINRLGKMEVPKDHHPKKRVDAFKNYVMARRHFGTSTAAGKAAFSAAPPVRTLPTSAPGRESLTRSLGGVKAEPEDRDTERAREFFGQGVANKKVEQLQEEGPGTIVNIVRLLLSCLHAWNLDEALDRECEHELGLVRPCRPVCFGLLSRSGCMSLVLPGWGLKMKVCTESEPGGAEAGGTFGRDSPHLPSGEKREEGVASSPHLPSEDRREEGGARGAGFLLRSNSAGFTFDQKYHVRWQLSRSLTTQHLLTMVSITNTLMNQSAGAHALSRSSGIRRKRSSFDDDSEDSDSEDAQTKRDSTIRAVWSQVAALHCVMLPERMEGRFRAPHLPVLASRFLDPCQAIREASQALLLAELRRIGAKGRRQLVQAWAGKLQPLVSFRSHDRPRRIFHEDSEISLSFHEETGPIPTQQQQTTALIILGMIGAEFNEGDHGVSQRKKGDQRSKEIEVEVMDPSIARQTAKTLQGVLLEKPISKTNPIFSNLRCSAAELISRGFQLWEKYVDIPQVIVGLLDLSIQYVPPPLGRENDPTPAKASSKSMKFTSEVSRKALNHMIILRPVTVVSTLAKEVAMYLASQHVTHFPHSSLPPIQVGVTPPPSTAGIVTQPNTLLPAAKGEILDLMKTVLEKSSGQVSQQLLEVVDVVLYCLESDQLKKKNIFDLFPAFSRISNISYSVKTKRLAVGGRSGQVGVYDLKQGRTHMVNAHSSAVTVLLFSEDGKMLATYSYGDSNIIVWQLGTSLFGGVTNPKQVSSWPAITGSPSASHHANYVRLEWQGSRSIILHMPEGVECKYSL